MFSVAGIGIEFVVTLSAKAGIRKHVAGGNDAGGAGDGACGLRHVLSDSFFEAIGCGNRAALSAWQCDRDRRPVSRGLHFEFLSENSCAGDALAELQALVWCNVQGCVTRF